MKFIFFLVISYMCGFLTAIPIGATQLEIAKRSISGYLKSALMVVLGSVVSDTMYGFIAMFGIAPFLKDKEVEAFFWFVGGLILLVLGIFTLIYNKIDSDSTEKTVLFKPHASLLIGFSLAVTNPPIMFWWIFCFEFLKSMGIVTHFTYSYASFFVVLGSFGIMSYLVLLSIFLKKHRKKISFELRYKINKVMGALLILMSFYFLFKSAGVFVRFKI